MTLGFSAAELQPKLFYDDAGDLFMRITVGKDTLVKPIPPLQTVEEARSFIDKLVPQMAKELYKSRKNKKRRFRRKLDGR